MKPRVNRRSLFSQKLDRIAFAAYFLGAVVPLGALAYWPAAQALMVFFGETPESIPGSDEPIAPGDVEIVGRLEDVAALRGAPEPERLRFEAG